MFRLHICVMILLVLCKSAQHVNSAVLKENLAFDKDGWRQAINNTKEGAFSVLIQSSSSQHSCDARFLSLTMGSSQVQKKFRGFSFGSKQLRTLAHGLSPSYLRLGGTSANFLTFDPDELLTQHDDGSDESKGLNATNAYDNRTAKVGKHYVNFTLSGDLWKNMTDFFQDVGWDLIFDFNLFKWRDGYWDPSNAQLLLNFSDAMGYDIAGFQLGNEPNNLFHKFNFSIDPPVLVRDFGILKSLTSQFTRYQKSPLFGPDVTGLHVHSSSQQYLQGFLQSGGGDLVSEISLHHYYTNGRTATVEDFLSLTRLDQLKEEIDIALQTIQSQPKPLPICFTETSSCYGGGAPGLSDAYVAGFLWLDKLGLSAKYGVTKVFRQTFYGSHYALLSEDALPNPDYFLSLLHKRLILGPVFDVTIQPANKLLRIYAHCTRTDFYNFPKGSLTLVYLNVAREDQIICLPEFHNQNFFFYSLTPGDNNGLKSRYVELNGLLLRMNGDQLPVLAGSLIHGHVTLPALTFGFIVIPEANVTLCKQHMASA